MPTRYTPANPNMLAWAREAAGFSVAEAADLLGIKEKAGASGADRLGAMETGDEQIPRSVVMKMTTKYRRPLLTFYLDTPPRSGDRGSDFRSVAEGRDRSDDYLVDALLRDVQARQGTVRWLLEQEEDAEERHAPLKFVGSAETEESVFQLASSIVEELDFSLDEFRSNKSPAAAFGYLRALTSDIGVFVLLIGDLGSHHSSIEPETFRGITLADSIAPFIVINDRDARSAWSFTLLHELTHVWLGQSGVGASDPDVRIEQFCNDVAAEVLLPRAEVAKLQLPRFQTTQEAVEATAHIGRPRNLSSSMVAYRLYREGRLSKAMWLDLKDELHRLWRTQRDRQREIARESEGAPGYYIVRRHRIGKPLIALVARSLGEGNLSTVQAGRVLGVKPQNVGELIDH